MGKTFLCLADSSNKYIHALLLQINTKTNLLHFLVNEKKEWFAC